ncbi:MAG: SCO family protein [Candidatus Omnitrophica bacterium]|nr:SCO family protein [Candidatus Omnitrophota bacterium]
MQHFILKDSEGREFNSDQLNGKVWIASFFFTTCSGICPLISKNMAALSRTFEQVEDITLVSITVNPDQDSPKALALYAKKFGDKKNWYFLTGAREDITEVVVVSFKLGDIQEPVFHTAFLPLVDSNGFIRGYYDGTKQEEIDRLLKDAAHLTHR